jgi:uncharacterized ferritin-like protein (DUF455 family)
VTGFFGAVRDCLQTPDPGRKCEAVTKLAEVAAMPAVEWDFGSPVVPIGPPGRPPAPVLVAPSELPRRRLGSAEGRAALVHAVAHIEFNAINLALDAIYRFRSLPRQYYLDWLSVAVDEARHFRLLQQRLRVMDSDYGDFPAHNGLWEMAEKTATACLHRMALVPRVLEARGLDVTPGMIERFSAAGDAETASVLETILREEVRHVAIGTHWFHYCCRREGREPLTTFLALLQEYYGGAIRGPLNVEARLQAGFSADEMDALAAAVRQSSTATAATEDTSR